MTGDVVTKQFLVGFKGAPDICCENTLVASGVVRKVEPDQGNVIYVIFSNEEATTIQGRFKNKNRL